MVYFFASLIDINSFKDIKKQEINLTIYLLLLR